MTELNLPRDGVPSQPPAELLGSLLDHDVAETARRNPGRFWLFLACACALVLMGLSAWRQGWFTPTSQLYVDLPGAVGVQVGTLVKLKGFKIGEVDEIDLQPNLNVKVRLRIVEERLELLGEDASAKFGRDGPIGGKFIEILPGSRAGKRLAANATLAMDSGNELEDVMATVKVAIEKLAVAISKVEPILDDTKKLTGEAAAMRQDIRSSVGNVLANMEAMSSQLKRMGEGAATVAGKMDADRQALVADMKKILTQADIAATSARQSLQTLEKDLPPLLSTTQAVLGQTKEATENVRASTADMRQIIQEARQDIPPTVRAARVAAQDAAQITQGIKSAWPVSGWITPIAQEALPLDGFEGLK